MPKRTIDETENYLNLKTEQSDAEDLDNSDHFNQHLKTVVMITKIIKKEKKINDTDLNKDEKPNTNQKFICDICNAKYGIKFFLEQHMRNKHNMAKNLCECQYCGIFISGRDYTRHIHLHEKPFTCDICLMQFQSKQNLRRHIEGIHINPSERRKVIMTKKEMIAIKKKFKCNLCGKGFNEKPKLDKHLLSKEYGFSCNICCKSFKFSCRLESHKLSHLLSATNSNNFKCDLCGQCFADEYQFNQHKLIKEYNFNCDLCCKSFQFNYRLQKHKLSHLSTAEKKLYMLKRSEMQKEKTSAAVKQTKLVKAKIKQSIIRVCQICGKICTTSSNFFQHKLSHSDKKPYKCEYCNKWFKSSSQVTLHVRTHTGEKPYKCKTCDMGFRSSSHLITHTKTHTGEKPHKCNFCEKTFAQKSNCRKHMRIHTGEKPYNCNICEENFIELNSLKKHMLNHNE